MQARRVARPYIRANCRLLACRRAGKLCGRRVYSGHLLHATQSQSYLQLGRDCLRWPSEATEVGGVQLFLMRFGHHDVRDRPDGCY